MTRKELIENIVQTLLESKAVSVGPPRNKRMAIYDTGGFHAMLDYVDRWREQHNFSRDEFNIAEGNWSQLLAAVPEVFRGNTSHHEGETGVYVLYANLPGFIRAINVALNRSSLQQFKKDSFEKYTPAIHSKDKHGIVHIGRQYHYFGEFDPFYYLTELRDVAMKAYKAGGDLDIG